MPNARGRSRHLGWAAVLVLVVAVALAATSSSALRGGKPLVPGPKQAAAPVTTTSPAATIPVATTAPHAPSPLALIKVTPRNHANDVGFRARVVVTYSRPPALDAPVPTIEPRMSGLWDQSGDRLVFVPTGDWALDATYRVTIPVPEVAGGGGPMVVKFTTGLPSVLMLQQYLAILGYLPLRFTPTGEVANRRAVLDREPAQAGRLPVVPMAGTFSWAYPGTPVPLQAEWHAGQLDELTTGAVMQFEMAQGLLPDGVPGATVWHALVHAVAAHQINASPYNYVVVSETLPETLYVWQDGKFVYNTLVNTGVPGAWTPQGTWPVAYKQNPNLMKGCDVDGSCYSVWVAYASYFLPSVGDAIHAYPRYGYGYPQSNGCVEVDPSAGAVVYGYDPVGTLVTVSSWVGPAQ